MKAYTTHVCVSNFHPKRILRIHTLIVLLTVLVLLNDLGGFFEQISIKRPVQSQKWGPEQLIVLSLLSVLVSVLSKYIYAIKARKKWGPEQLIVLSLLSVLVSVLSKYIYAIKARKKYAGKVSIIT